MLAQQTTTNPLGRRRQANCSLLIQLWRDEDGIVFASEWMLLCTLLLVATFVGIYVARTASMKLFVNVAIGIAREQGHTFDKIDVDDDEGNDNGRYGYRHRETPEFFDYVPDQPDGTDGGETPAEHNLAGAVPEGGNSF